MAMRNHTIDLCRLVAACLIVFIHYELPGDGGIAMRGIARFAVPFFFAVSGYYCGDASVSRVMHRMRSILRIALVSCLLYLVWGCLESMMTGLGIEGYLAKTFTVQAMARWLFLGHCPLGGHLWYLFAIVTVYLLLAAVAVLGGKDRVDLRGLYAAGAAAALVFVTLDLCANGWDVHVNYRVYRNGLLMGLPLFLLGDAVRRAADGGGTWVLSNARTAALVAAVGIPVTLLQEFGIGKSELPIGSVLTMIGLLALAIDYPHPRFLLSVPFLSSLFADASLAIYVIHPMVGRILRTMVEPFRSMPVEVKVTFTTAVLVISVLLGFVYAATASAFRGRRQLRAA